MTQLGVAEQVGELAYGRDVGAVEHDTRQGRDLLTVDDIETFVTEIVGQDELRCGVPKHLQREEVAARLEGRDGAGAMHIVIADTADRGD